MALLRFRRGTAAAWTSANPTLSSGEPGYETDTGQVKMGDGSTAWTSLDYLTGDTGGGETVPTASTTVAGIVELATNAETTTGTDTARATTPAGVAAAVSAAVTAAAPASASTTVSGLVELATNTETITGTDTARAVTPAGFAAALASGISGKLDKIAARVSGDTAASWKTAFTGTGFGTTVQNIAEHVVPMKASATVSSFLAGWVNEWGALRGTSPYTWGDALVRAVRAVSDGITSGNFIELDDRQSGSSFIRYGRTWTTGALVRNAYAVREAYVWRTGDSDPTASGTIALPTNATWVIVLSTLGGTVPSWAPANSIIIEPSA